MVYRKFTSLFVLLSFFITQITPQSSLLFAQTPITIDPAAGNQQPETSVQAQQAVSPSGPVNSNTTQDFLLDTGGISPPTPESQSTNTFQNIKTNTKSLANDTENATPIRAITISNVNTFDGAFNYSFDIDTSKNAGSGALIRSDGVTTPGMDYKFVEYTDTQWSGWSILRILTPKYSYTPGTARENIDPTYLFLVNQDRSEFTFLGTYRNSASTTAILEDGMDLSQDAWKLMPKFFHDPLSLSAEEFQKLTNGFKTTRNIYESDSPIFGDSFTPIYLSTILKELAKHPNYNLDSNLSVRMFSGLSQSFTLSMRADQVEPIIELMAEVWSTLSLSTKKLLLTLPGSNLNSKSCNQLGKLFISYLDSYAQSSTSQRAIFEETSSLLSLAQRVVTNLNVDTHLKSQIVERILEISAAVQPFQAQFGNSSHFNIINFMDVLQKSGGLAIDLSLYEAQMTLILSRVLSSLAQKSDFNFFDLDVVNKTFNHMLQYVEPSLAGSLLNLFIGNQLAKYQGKADQLRLLMNALNWPISNVHRNSIKQIVLAKLNEGFSNFSLSDLSTIVSSQSPNAYQFSNYQLESKFFNNLINEYYSRIQNLALDSSSRSLLAEIIEFAKKSQNFDLLSQEFLSHLKDFNPKFNNESAEDYGIRLHKVEELWTQLGVFLVDLGGGMRQGVYRMGNGKADYVDFVTGALKNRAGWIHVVELTSDNDQGNARPMYVKLGWKSTNPIEIVVGTLIHESGHAMFESDEYQDGDIDPTRAFFFNENSQWNNQNFVSDYAGSNNFEFVAETYEAWVVDSRLWLGKAIQNYQEGHPSMLNMFLFLTSRTMGDELAETFLFPIYKLDKQTGLLDAKYFVGVWEMGSRKQGIFKFIVDDKLYSLTYTNYQISNLNISEAGIIPFTIFDHNQNGVYSATEAFDVLRERIGNHNDTYVTSLRNFFESHLNPEEVNRLNQLLSDPALLNQHHNQPTITETTHQIFLGRHTLKIERVTDQTGGIKTFARIYQTGNSQSFKECEITSYPFEQTIETGGISYKVKMADQNSISITQTLKELAFGAGSLTGAGNLKIEKVTNETGTHTFAKLFLPNSTEALKVFEIKNDFVIDETNPNAMVIKATLSELDQTGANKTLTLSVFSKSNPNADADRYVIGEQIASDFLGKTITKGTTWHVSGSGSTYKLEQSSASLNEWGEIWSAESPAYQTESFFYDQTGKMVMSFVDLFAGRRTLPSPLSDCDLSIIFDYSQGGSNMVTLYSRTNGHELLNEVFQTLNVIRDNTGFITGLKGNTIDGKTVEITLSRDQVKFTVVQILNETILSNGTLKIEKESNESGTSITYARYYESGSAHSSKQFQLDRTNLNTTIINASFEDIKLIRQAWNTLYTQSEVLTLEQKLIDAKLNLLKSNLKLDFDGNGKQDALSDGILLLRYLAGFKGNDLINNAVDPSVPNLTAQMVESRIAQAITSNLLDVYTTGSSDFVDGEFIIRSLSGFTGNSLTNGILIAPNRVIDKYGSVFRAMDQNQDGVTTSSEAFQAFLEFQNSIGASQGQADFNSQFDFNQDGVINLSDRDLFTNTVLPVLLNPETFYEIGWRNLFQTKLGRAPKGGKEELIQNSDGTATLKQYRSDGSLQIEVVYENATLKKIYQKVIHHLDGSKTEDGYYYYPGADAYEKIFYDQMDNIIDDYVFDLSTSQKTLEYIMRFYPNSNIREIIYNLGGENGYLKETYSINGNYEGAYSIPPPPEANPNYAFPPDLDAVFDSEMQPFFNLLKQKNTTWEEVYNSFVSSHTFETEAETRIKSIYQTLQNREPSEMELEKALDFLRAERTKFSDIKITEVTREISLGVHTLKIEKITDQTSNVKTFVRIYQTQNSQSFKECEITSYPFEQTIEMGGISYKVKMADQNSISITQTLKELAFGAGSLTGAGNLKIEKVTNETGTHTFAKLFLPNSTEALKVFEIKNDFVIDETNPNAMVIKATLSELDQTGANKTLTLSVFSKSNPNADADRYVIGEQIASDFLGKTITKGTTWHVSGSGSTYKLEQSSASLNEWGEIWSAESPAYQTESFFYDQTGKMVMSFVDLFAGRRTLPSPLSDCDLSIIFDYSQGGSNMVTLYSRTNGHELLNEVFQTLNVIRDNTGFITGLKGNTIDGKTVEITLSRDQVKFTVVQILNETILSNGTLKLEKNSDQSGTAKVFMHITPSDASQPAQVYEVTQGESLNKIVTLSNMLYAVKVNEQLAVSTVNITALVTEIIDQNKDGILGAQEALKGYVDFRAAAKYYILGDTQMSPPQYDSNHYDLNQNGTFTSADLTLFTRAFKLSVTEAVWNQYSASVAAFTTIDQNKDWTINAPEAFAVHLTLTTQEWQKQGSGLKCDFNQDGVTNDLDKSVFMSTLQTVSSTLEMNRFNALTRTFTAMDQNQDGIATANEAFALLTTLKTTEWSKQGSGLKCDFNQDGSVDIKDISFFVSTLQTVLSASEMTRFNALSAVSSQIGQLYQERLGRDAKLEELNAWMDLVRIQSDIRIESIQGQMNEAIDKIKVEQIIAANQNTILKGKNISFDVMFEVLKEAVKNHKGSGLAVQLTTATVSGSTYQIKFTRSDTQEATLASFRVESGKVLWTSKQVYYPSSSSLKLQILYHLDGKTVKSENEYSLKGKPIRSVIRDTQGIVLSATETDYQTDGITRAKYRYYGSNNVLAYEYAYQSDGSTYKTVTYYYPGGTLVKSETQYNEKNKLKSQVTKDLSGAVTSYVQYDYQADQVTLLEFRNYLPNQTGLISRYVYQADGKTMKSSTFYHPDGVTVNAEYEYNEKGKVTRSVQKNLQGVVTFCQVTSYYSDQVTRFEEKRYQADQTTLASDYLYRSDGQNLQKVTNYYPNSSIIQSESEFNAKGRITWTTQRNTQGQITSYIEVRYLTDQTTRSEVAYYRANKTLSSVTAFYPATQKTQSITSYAANGTTVTGTTRYDTTGKQIA